MEASCMASQLAGRPERSKTKHEKAGACCFSACAADWLYIVGFCITKKDAQLDFICILDSMSRLIDVHKYIQKFQKIHIYSTLNYNFRFVISPMAHIAAVQDASLMNYAKGINNVRGLDWRTFKRRQRTRPNDSLDDRPSCIARPTLIRTFSWPDLVSANTLHYTFE